MGGLGEMGCWAEMGGWGEMSGWGKLGGWGERDGWGEMDKSLKICEFTVLRNKNIEVIRVSPLYCNYTSPE